MNRTITIRGRGRATLKPDLTVIRFTLKSTDPVYDAAMEKEEKMLAGLKNALLPCGFTEEELKTSDFSVSAEYENVRDPKGNYKNVFIGYACVQRMTLEFDFDTKKLSRVLSSVSSCLADPELSVNFSVKDRDAANKMLLENAAKDAKEKAEILAAASGVSLGSLVSVLYGVSDRNFVSPTSFRAEAKCMAVNRSADMSFVPEDIKLEDTVTFLWEIC